MVEPAGAKRGSKAGAGAILTRNGSRRCARRRLLMQIRRSRRSVCQNPRQRCGIDVEVGLVF